MAKNAYARKISNHMAQDRLQTQRIVRQMVTDMAQVALGRMGYGKVRQRRFYDKFIEVYAEYADLINTDVQDDPDFVYAKAKLDAELSKCCGEYFTPWEVRYYT